MIQCDIKRGVTNETLANVSLTIFGDLIGEGRQTGNVIAACIWPLTTVHGTVIVLIGDGEAFGTVGVTRAGNQHAIPLIAIIFRIVLAVYGHSLVSIPVLVRKFQAITARGTVQGTFGRVFTLEFEGNVAGGLTAQTHP